MEKYIIKILDKLKKVLDEEIGKIIFISVFNSISYGVNRYFLTKYTSYSLGTKILKLVAMTLGEIFFWIFIFFTLSFFYKKIKKIIILFVEFFVFIFGLINIFLLVNFKTLLNSSTVQIFFETNMREGKEFLISYFNIKFIIILLFGGIFYFLTQKLKIKIKNKLILFLILIVSSINFCKNNLKDKALFGGILALNNGINNIKIYKNIEKNMKSDIEIKKVENKIKNIVLIIGESTTRNHMSLYGYEKETTPYLTELKLNKKINVFTDVITSNVYTILSLQKILTFYNNDSINEWYENNNIVDIMKKVGYTTYWFSNQEPFGKFGNVAAVIGNRSDIVYFNEIRESGEEAFNKYDIEIVENSKKYLNNNNNFVIYHLLGTHADYKYRYPDKYKKFSENDYDKNINKKQKKDIANYDNAILYNDYVINEIINLYKKEESIIIYISDHGEEVYDYREFKGHSEEDISRYMLEIPFLIFMSDKFKEKYPGLEKAIENSLNKPYMIDDLIHTILDISGIITLEYDETKSLINKRFNEKRKRIIHNKLYEEYWKNKN